MRNPTTEKYLEEYAPEYDPEFRLSLIDTTTKLNTNNPGRLGEGLNVPYAKSLAQVLDTWGDITFNYASTDTPDFVPTASAA